MQQLVPARRVLITGGAGFIGSHLADQLIERGHHVRILDNLDPQVHGPDAGRPEYLNDQAELQVGDVRDAEAVRAALQDVDVVVHLAAAVGVGQSMYEVARYTSANDLGTAVLLENLVERPVERLIVASSMSIYGEGRYQTVDGDVVTEADRTRAQLKAGDWEPKDAEGRPLQPQPTPESKRPSLASIYALNKYQQEQACLIIGRAYDIPTVALRLFNVYGTRQALSNPYTGVMAIFLSRLLNGNPPLIYEDGAQQRDFVSVHDVAGAFRQVIEDDAVRSGVFNIGSGASVTVTELARRAVEAVGATHIEPRITGQYRIGDIRHCFADVRHARDVLGYRPRIGLDEGLQELTEWLATQEAQDRVDDAHHELSARGLTV